MNPQVLLLSIQPERITRLNIATGPGSTQRETLVPAGRPVNTRRPDGMSYGPRSTPDTPFTDHSGEPLPAWPLHLPPHCKYIVNACQLPPAKRLDNKRFVKWVYWFIYRFSGCSLFFPYKYPMSSFERIAIYRLVFYKAFPCHLDICIPSG